MGSGMNAPQLHPAISLGTNPDYDNLTFIYLKWEQVVIDPHQNNVAAGRLPILQVWRLMAPLTVLQGPNKSMKLVEPI